MGNEKRDLEIGEELDGLLDGALTPEDRKFVRQALKALRAGGKLKALDSAKLKKKWEKYFGEKDESEGEENPDEEEKNPDEEGIDDDDFV